MNHSKVIIFMGNHPMAQLKFHKSVFVKHFSKNESVNLRAEDLLTLIIPFKHLKFFLQLNSYKPTMNTSQVLKKQLTRQIVKIRSTILISNPPFRMQELFLRVLLCHNLNLIVP